jgi:hypothetical protein
MTSKRSEIGDEENTSFELRGSVLEDLKPGLVDEEVNPGDATEGHAHEAEVDHRFPRRDRKDIPQGSLAERLRKAEKGG